MGSEREVEVVDTVDIVAVVGLLSGTEVVVVLVMVVFFLIRGIGTGFPFESMLANWKRCLSLSLTSLWSVSNVRFRRVNFGILSYPPYV